MNEKLLICDINETLTTTISGADFKQHSKDVKILPGALAGLQTYHEEGWRIVAISNEAGIPKYKSLNSAIAEFKYTMELLPQLESVYFCPDFQGEQCYHIDKECRVVAIHEWKKYKPLIGAFRKPNPGMIILARQNELSILNRKSSILMIGDMETDKEAAMKAKIDFQDAYEWRSQFFGSPPF